MPVKNKEVVRMWREGRAATNHKRTLYAQEDGSLWSYHLKIGQRTSGGVRLLAEYTAAGEYVSQTTSCHVNMAKPHATQVWHPKVWNLSEFSEKVPF